MPTTVITGANRGIGLELTRRYAADGWTVHACCRKPDAATALAELAASEGADVHVHRVDVTLPADTAALAAALGDAPVDVLINNAGVLVDRDSGSGVGSMDYDSWRRTLEVNTLGPMRVTEALVDHVARSDRKLNVILTSRMGSIADNTSGGYYAYRSSKAAVNMVAQSLHHDLRGRGVSTVVLHPGWVQTDMGGASAPLSVEQSVAGLREVIAGLDPEKSGRFFAYDGEEIRW